MKQRPLCGSSRRSEESRQKPQVFENHAQVGGAEQHGLNLINERAFKPFFARISHPLHVTDGGGDLARLLIIACSPPLLLRRIPAVVVLFFRRKL
ncbi:hypothetical protein ACFQ3P_41155 [Paraburkholderia sabiae]|uniref:Uncharacterized protein n=1 Tax=Paraburkholderia sabiae TaxID=273251 RepID=A0ABU9QU48_9BURK|nr:hypothetical protein [Paraburkholderia sabiae]WJZ79553.1 hypothetical protein QEN71_40305 [Paraburkholderia sabiae]